MVIRKIRIEDAEQFIDLNKKLVSETDFLLLNSNESSLTVETQKKLIKDFNINNNRVVFVIEIDKNLIGFIAGTKGIYKKNKHVLTIAIGILQEHNGLGYGKSLLKYIEEWAIENNVKRLELTVRNDNERAINLYKKFGFDIEGIKLKSLKINDKYFDEFYMSKILL